MCQSWKGSKNYWNAVSFSSVFQFLKINIKRNLNPWWTAGKTTWQIPKREFFFPWLWQSSNLKTTRTADKSLALLCFREQRCHDSVFFCQRSVTANAKGPGPLRYKGQNQWSFGKTDGKPLADRWEGRGREEPSEARRGWRGTSTPNTITIVTNTTNTSRRRHSLPRPLFSLSDEREKKPPELQQPSQYRSDFPETTFRPRDWAKMYSGTDQNNHAHASHLLMSVHTKKGDTRLRAAHSQLPDFKL